MSKYLVQTRDGAVAKFDDQATMMAWAKGRDVVGWQHLVGLDEEPAWVENCVSGGTEASASDVFARWTAPTPPAAS